MISFITKHWFLILAAIAAYFYFSNSSSAASPTTTTATTPTTTLDVNTVVNDILTTFNGNTSMMNLFFKAYQDLQDGTLKQAITNLQNLGQTQAQIESNIIAAYKNS